MGMRQARHVAATSLCIACDLHGSNVADEALMFVVVRFFYFWRAGFMGFLLACVAAVGVV